MRIKLPSIILISVILVILLLILLNHRYPFWTPTVGNWSVGYQTAVEIPSKLEVKPEGLITFEFVDSIISEEVDYIADPFFLKERDTFYLFVELKGKGNADIALFTSADGKKYEYQEVILDESFHLSYPQVFKYEESFYMLPETKGSKNILLYKAQDFPFDWKIEDTLVKNINLKGPTILLTENINLIVAVDDNLKQYMFTADSLLGDWTEAENYSQLWGNETRPAGRFFERNNEWFLPVQNHRRGYGTGVSIYQLATANEELRLSLTEKLFLEPQPKIIWFNRGMHHLDVQRLDEIYYMVYDGDQNLNNKKEFKYIRTLKLNLIDLYNLLDF